jgi:DNA-entry nuclease
MKRFTKQAALISLLLTLCLQFWGCGSLPAEALEGAITTVATTEVATSEETTTENSATEVESTSESAQTETISLEDIPEYSGEPYVEINGNQPDFTEDELTTESYEEYDDLDELGRCTEAIASIGTDLMPTEERGAIGQVKPSGWHTVKYDNVDGKYLYNRCHLIGYQLTAENANENNLITGTRYLNVEGMLPFENMVTEYIKETSNHVLYKVVPIFEGDNLVASGVQMEAESVEDGGAGISYNVYVYNVQPGIEIDYATGDSWESDATIAEKEDDNTEQTYILNTNSGKFHDPNCSSVADIKDSNKVEYTGTREKLINGGYEPCGRCKP